MKRCNNCGWFNFDAVSQCEKCGEESFEPIVESNEAASEAAVVEEAPQVVVKEEPKVEPEQAAAVSNSFMATVAFGSDKAKPKVSEPKPKKDLRATVVFDSDKPMPEFEEVKPKNNLKSTVAFDSDMAKPGKVSEPQPKKDLRATVVFSSDMPVPEVEEAKPKNNFNATVPIGSGMPAPSAVTVKDAVDAQQMMAAPVKCPRCCYPITGYVEYCPNCGATIKNAPKPAAAGVVVNGNSPKVDRNLAKTVRDFSSSLKATVAERLDNGPVSETYRLVNIDAPNVPAIEVRLGEVFVVNGVRYKLEK